MARAVSMRGQGALRVPELPRPGQCARPWAAAAACGQRTGHGA